MRAPSPKLRGRLEMQGYTGLDDAHLSEISPWVRVVPALVVGWTAVGIALGSAAVFWVLTPVALMGALPRHPLDAVYDRGLRHVLGTRAIPASGLPKRVAFTVIAVTLCTAAISFQSGVRSLGRALGTVVLVSELLYLSTLLCPVSALLALIVRLRRRRTSR